MEKFGGVHERGINFTQVWVEPIFGPGPSQQQQIWLAQNFGQFTQ